MKSFGNTAIDSIFNLLQSDDVDIKLTWINETSAVVEYNDVKAVTPGQACVVYLGEQCLMGGIIKQVFKDGKDLWYLK